MIRHLVRLIRPVGGDPLVLAPAIYAEPAGEGWRMPPARDQGFEGVACVDDAARAAIVFLRLATEGDCPAMRTARGLVAYLVSMQVADGRFHNFTRDWDGTTNIDGPTSVPGGPWSARAAHALAVAGGVFGDPELTQRARWCLAALGEADENLDVHAVSALAALEVWRVTGARADAARCRRLCEAIAAGRRGDVLLDTTARNDVHLWGRLQEAALSEAGSALGIRPLVEVARRSADRVLLPAIEHLATRSTQAFEASCVAVGLESVAAATGVGHYREAAGCARAWFLGRNAAGLPVYDVPTGAVHDGVDEQRVSANAGAEASIEGANALLGVMFRARRPAARLRASHAGVVEPTLVA